MQKKKNTGWSENRKVIYITYTHKYIYVQSSNKTLCVYLKRKERSNPWLIYHAPESFPGFLQAFLFLISVKSFLQDVGIYHKPPVLNKFISGLLFHLYTKNKCVLCLLSEFCYKGLFWHVLIRLQPPIDFIACL